MANGVELATGYVSLTVDGSRLGRGISDAVNRAGGAAGRSGSGIGTRLAAGMTKALKGGAIAAGAAAAVGLGFALTKGFERLSAIDAAKKKLAGLGNSAKDIDVIMKNANQSVKGTAFGLDEAATTAASAVAAGIKPGAQLQGVLNTVADTATIAGTSMSDMGTIFGSVAARGKLQGDDLMQLQERGVPVLAFLAKHYHATAAAASQMVTKGQVDFKNFNAAMQENLGGAAKKSGDTVQGAFANLKASFGRIGAGLLSGVFPKIAPLLQNITKAMGPLETKAEDLGAKFGGVLAKAFDVLGTALSKINWSTVGRSIGDIATAIGSKLSGTIKSINWAAFGQGMSSAFAKIGPLVQSIRAFAQQFMSTVYPIVAGAFKSAVKSFPGALSGTITALTRIFNILRPMTPVIVGLIAAFATFRILTSIANAVHAMRVAMALMNATLLANPFILIAAALVGLGVALVIAYKKSATFRAIVNGAFGAVKSVVLGVVNWFRSSFVPFFTKTIPGAFQSVLNFVKSHWRLILSLITGPIGAAVILVASNWSKIKSAFSAAWGWVKSTFARAWSGVKGILSGAVNAAHSAISGTISRIKGVFNGIWSWASGTFRRSWNGLKAVLEAPVTLARSFIDREVNGFKNIFRSVRDGIGSIWSGLKSKITSPISSIVSWVGAHFVNPINSMLKKVGVGFRIPWPGYSSGGVLPGGGRRAVAYASGGVLPGWSPGTDDMHFFSPQYGGLSLSGGEGIARPEVVRAMGANAFNALNAAARSGGVSGVRKALGFAAGGIIPRRSFGIGGIVGGTWDKIKGGVSALWGGAKFLADLALHPLDAVKKLANKLLGGIAGNMWGQLAKGAIGKVAGGLGQKVADFFSGGGGGASGGGGNYPVSGGVQRWAGVAREAMAMAGLSPSFLPLLLHRMMVESGGNPRAINLWDSNARAGIPSQGLMQVIPPTFAAYAGALRGRGILDPLANIYAAIRYTLSRYGLSGIAGAWGGTAGYARGGILPVFDNGGTLAPGINVVNNRTGAPERLIRADRSGLSDSDRALLLRSIQTSQKVLAAMPAAVESGLAGRRSKDAQSTHLARRGGY